MKPLADDEETVVLNAKVPRSLRDRVDRYQTDHQLANRSEATRQVLERGLPENQPNGAHP